VRAETFKKRHTPFLPKTETVCAVTDSGDAHGRISGSSLSETAWALDDAEGRAPSGGRSVAHVNVGPVIQIPSVTEP